MAELFQRDKSTISRHIKNIFSEGELTRNSVVANFATTESDGKTYQVDYYNLDVILSHIGLFGLEVLFIVPDMNFELLTFKQKFFPHCGNGAYNWTAHATLLIDEPEKISKALPILAKNFKPFIARIESIGLYEFFPMRFIKECSLINTV
jgi:hypothetical protein